MADSSKKARINAAVSILSQVVTLILGMLIPKIILTSYGSDANGLTNTISQIFTYLALLETGISSSAKNALYKPIRNDDRNGISYWVSLARRYYRKICRIYFLIIVGLSFLIPFFLKSNVDYWTIVFYFFFEGLTSVVSFYFLNSWTCFLSAKGDNYLINVISLVTRLLMYGVKIALSIAGVNIALVQVGYFVISLVQVLIYALFMKKQYGWINYNESPKGAKLPDKNSYLLTEIAWTVFSSTDMIILSFFVSTKLSSVYSIYNMVFVAINGLFNALFVSLSYNLGHSFVADKSRYKKLHDLFNSLFLGGVTALLCVTYFLILPFVKIYTSGINDIDYIYEWLPLLFCMVQLLSWCRHIASYISGVAGYAKPTAIASVAETIINIFLSVLLVNVWGIYGVLIATVIALLPKVVFLNYQCDSKILNRSPSKTVKIIAVNVAIFGLTVFLKRFISLPIEDFYSFCLAGAIMTALYVPTTFVLNCLVNKDLLTLFLEYIKKHKLLGARKG